MKKRILKTLLLATLTTAFYFAFKIGSELIVNAKTENININGEEEIIEEIEETEDRVERIESRDDIRCKQNLSYDDFIIPYSGEYDGNSHTITTNIPSSLNLYVQYSTDNETFTSSRPSYTDVGYYTFYYKLISLSNRGVVWKGQTYVEIKKKTVDTSSCYTGEIQEFTYDGNAHSVTYTITKPEEATDVYVASEPHADAGTYYVTYSFVYDTSKYIINDLNIEWRILPKEVQVLWNIGGSYTYNGTVQTTPAASYIDDDYNIHPLDVTFDREFKDAGTYTATATKNDDYGNYKLSESTTTNNYYIKQASIEDYDIELVQNSFVYDGKAHGVEVKSITSENITGEITCSPDSETNSFTDYKEGGYQVKICGTGNFKGEQYVTAYIIQCEKEVIWPTDTKYSYSGNVQQVTATFVDVFGETITLEATTDREFKEVGEYTATIVASQTNYTFTNTTSTITMNKKVVDTSSCYTGEIQEFTYDGNAHSVTYNITKPEEATAMAIGSETHVSAGTYYVTYSFLYDTSKYVIDNLEIEWRILPKEVSIIWYDGVIFTYNGEVQKASAFYMDIDCKYCSLDVTFEEEFKNAGTYTATASKTDGNINYKLADSNLTHEFTINPASIEDYDIEVVQDTFAYDGKSHSIEVASITSENITGDITYSIDSETNSFIDYEEGGHQVRIYGTGNFAGEQYVSAYITPHEVAIVWPTNMKYSYNGNVQKVNPTFVDISGETVYLTSYSDREFKDAGDYELVANTSSYTNYSFTNTTYSTSIRKAFSSIVFYPIEYTYDGTVQNVVAYYTNVFNEKCYVDVSTSREFKNVGDYVATANVSSITNYLFNSTSCGVKINPLAVDVIWQENNFVYNGKVQEISASFIDAKGNEVALTVTTDNEFKEIGNYVATTSCQDTNYSLNNTTNNYSIATANVDVIWQDDDYTYNGNVQEISAKYIDVMGNEIALTVAIDNEFKNAGEYTATVTCNDDKYTLNNPQKTYTIKKLDISDATITLDHDSLIYNGLAHEITITSVVIENVGDVDYEIDGTLPNPTDYEEEGYEVKINGINNFTGSCLKVVMIEKCNVEVNWQEDNFVYNENVQEIKATYTNVNNEEVDLVVTIDKEFKNVGSYQASVSLDKNYSATNLTKEYTIKKYEVVVNWQEDDFVYSGDIQEIEASYVDHTGEIINLEVTINNKFKYVGDYEASISIENDSYNVTNPTKSYTIKPLKVEAIWDEKTLTYNGKTQEVNASYIDAANVSRTLEITIDNEFVNAGTYIATACLDNSNYELTNPTKEYTILPLAVEAIWSKDSFTYNGLEHEIRATYLDVSNKSNDLVVENGKNIEANSYIATASIDDSNYELTNTSHEYIIKPLEVETIWVEKTYTYNGNTQKIVAKYEDAFGSIVEVEATTDKEFKNAGTYQASVVSNDSNYTLANTTYEYTISPLEVSVIFEEKEYIYNGNAQAIEAYINDISNNKVALNVVCEEEIKDAKAYEVKATLEDSNYTLVDALKTITIKPYNVDATCDKKTYNYNGATQEVVFTYKDINNNDVTIYTLDIKNVGNYNVSLELKDSNYKLNETEFVVTMNRGKIAIPDTKVISYDYTGSLITFIPEGFDSNTMTIKNNAHAESNTDGYVVTISLKDKDNYTWSDGTIDDKSYTFKINNATTAKKGCKSSLIPSLFGLLVLAGCLIISKKKRII